MKINFDLDIDLFDEDGNGLQEQIKERIISELIKKIFETSSEKFEFQTSERVREKIDEMIAEFFKSFLERKITVTNRYGDPQEIGTIEEIVKKRFDNWADEKVDKEGRTDRYDKNYTRIEWIVNNRLEKYGQDFIKRAITEVSNKLEETLSENLRDMIGKKIADKIGLNKLLPKIKGT